MALLSAVLILLFLLGFLAQSIGLCMVRGVKEWQQGNPSFLLAILASGVLAWVAALTSYYLEIPLRFRIFEPSWWFAFGGLVFGIGTAFNQGCGVSTLGKLSRGDFNMVATVLGWLAGWSILAQWQPNIATTPLPMRENLTYSILFVLSICLSLWALFGNRQRKQLWFSMMGIGLLAGFIFLYEHRWTPSALLHDLSSALFTNSIIIMPGAERYLLIAALLAGMMVAALTSKRFSLVIPSTSDFFMHLVAGTLMGIGASLAMGGNDSQLLLALPVFSVAGIIATASMIPGIFIGLHLQIRYRRLFYDND